jgi:acyl-CoA thioester hydrolase
VKIHHYKQYVNFSDVDMGGGLYHPRYLDYFDRARMSALRDNGIYFGELIHSGFALVVASLSIDYIRPSFFEEELHIYTVVRELSSKSIKVEQIITTKELSDIDHDLKNKSDIKSRVNVVLVCVSLGDKKSCNMPMHLKEKVELSIK